MKILRFLLTHSTRPVPSILVFLACSYLHFCFEADGTAMSFRPAQDTTCCKRCGLCSFTQKDCPQCNICIYCKKSGHLVRNCVRAPSCSLCKVKGHPEQYCPQAVVKYSSLRPAKRMRTYQSEQSTDMSISVVSPKHDESRWFAIPKDIREVFN